MCNHLVNDPSCSDSALVDGPPFPAREATRTTCTPPLPHTKLNAKCRTRRCQFPPVLRGERAVVGHSKGYGHGGGGGVYARAWVAARPARFGCLLNAFKLVRSPDREAPEGYHCHRSFPAFEGRLLAAVPGEGVRGGSAGTPGAVSCRAGPHVHQCCGAVRGWSGGWGGRKPAATEVPAGLPAPAGRFQ